MNASLLRTAYEHIRTRLITWDPEQDGLLSEVALARDLGVSRTPVREAVSQLVIEGLVERKPGHGVMVKTMTRAELAETMDLRQALETYANGRAARRISAQGLTQLRELVFRLRAISRQMVDQNEWDGPLYRELAITDAAFHLVLLDAAACSRTAKIISDLRLLAQRFTSRRMQSVWNVARVQRNHWRIYQAVRQHDVRAARAFTARSIRETKRIELQLYDQRELKRLPESLTQSMWRDAVQWAAEHRIDLAQPPKRGRRSDE